MQEELSEKEQKMTFLTQEIIEQNYDPRLFTNFCETMKEANLDLWSLEELKICVRDFKQKYQSGQTLEQIQDTGTISIDCLKRGQSELSSTPLLKVTISGPKIANQGFLSSERVFYLVETLPMNWEVQREYTDFIWLRKALKTSLPGIFIPPLQPPKIRGDLTEDTLIKRPHMLSKFMKTLISAPLALREENLRIFLKQMDTKAFKSYMDSVKLSKISDIKKFPSIDGKVTGDLIDHSDYFIKMEQYYESNSSIMRRLKKKSYEIIGEIEDINNSILDIIETLAKLKNIQESFSFTSKYEKIYCDLKTTFEGLSKVQLKKIEMVNQHLSIFFKYGNLEQKALYQFIHENDKYAFRYRKALIKHNEGIEKVREFYAYFNSQNITETTRINQQITFNTFENFFEFSLKQAELTKDLQAIWKELLQDCVV
jgi:PX domain